MCTYVHVCVPFSLRFSNMIVEVCFRNNYWCVLFKQEAEHENIPSTVSQANLDLAFSSLFICGEKMRNNFIPLCGEREQEKGGFTFRKTSSQCHKARRDEVMIGTSTTPDILLSIVKTFSRTYTQCQLKKIGATETC